jgi:hypothetical protein
LEKLIESELYPFLYTKINSSRIKELRIKSERPGMVVHIGNASYLRGRDRS